MLLMSTFYTFNYDIFQTIFNLEKTIIFTKNGFRWGWIQRIDNNYLYGYIERYEIKKVSKKELLEELKIGISRYITLFKKDTISNKYIEEILKIPNRADILNKYKKIKYLKSNELKKLKQILENNGYEVLAVKSKTKENILFRTSESDWQIVSFNKNLEKLVIGFLNIEMDILFYKVFNKSDIIENNINTK